MNKTGIPAQVHNPPAAAQSVCKDANYSRVKYRRMMAIGLTYDWYQAVAYRALLTPRNPVLSHLNN